MQEYVAMKLLKLFSLFLKETLKLKHTKFSISFLMMLLCFSHDEKRF